MDIIKGTLRKDSDISEGAWKNISSELIGKPVLKDGKVIGTINNVNIHHECVEIKATVPASLFEYSGKILKQHIENVDGKNIKIIDKFELDSVSLKL